MRQWGPIVILVFALLSCGTQKTNTLSRAYHSLKTRYNLLYNVRRTFEDVRLQQVQQSKEIYTLASSLDVIDSTQVEAYHSILSRCERAILSHSLRQRPTNWRKLPPQQIEYNPTIYKVWLLLAEAQYYNKHLREALHSFEHISYLYDSDLRIKSYALLWQIRCLIGLGRASDADFVLQELQSLPTNIHQYHRRIRLLALSELAIAQGKFHQAIPSLVQALKQTHRSESKARLYYALALCHKATADTTQAQKNYRKAISYTLQESRRLQYISDWQHQHVRQDSTTTKPLPTATLTPSSSESSATKLYPIDWAQVYADDISHATPSTPKREKTQPQALNLQYRIGLGNFSPSEILFLASVFTYKNYTQSTIRLRIEDKDKQSIILHIFGFKYTEQLVEYQKSLEKRLCDEGITHELMP